MKKYKVQITKENFRDFAEYYNADKKRVEDALELLRKEQNVTNYRQDFYKKAERMFNTHFMRHDSWKYTFSLEDKNNQTLEILVNYCAEHNLTWHVDSMTEHYLYISFSDNHMFWDKSFCTMVEMPDYDALSLGEIRARLGNNDAAESLPAEISSLTINSINEEQKNLKSMTSDLQKQMDDIQYAKTEELKQMEEEITRLKNELYERKQSLLAEVQAKIVELNEKKAQLDKQVYMLESEIYTIRSYSGETIELRKVRDGKKASPETPLVINQKIMYLDEDLARIVSIYQSEISQRYNCFEDAVKYSDEVFESFCPQERCLTFFRLSKNATYRYYNAERNMYDTEELLHGKKMGCILRDGDTAHMFWMDDYWKTDDKGEPIAVTFSENLMYRPNKEGTYADADDVHEMENDGTNTMLSRVFAIFVVQGILDNKGLLEFPEKVSITKPGSYITYNFASGWLTDDRFGDFATLVDNLNKRTKIGDQILVCYQKDFCRGRGEKNRAHDCKVPEGINRVNFLESDEYGHSSIYVSAKKLYSYKGATANVVVYKNEYINITYMNSIWLSYYVQTKKMGKYAEDYAKMVKHFKRAIEILKEREAEEMSYIKKYFPEADQIPEWEIKLSHWKLKHNIRVINDFQGKRIAKYLQAGNFEEIEHLFEQEVFYNENATVNGTCERTNFHYVSDWDKKADVGEFEKGSPYYMQKFYVKDLYTGNYIRKEQQEENAIKIAAELPKLEALVPDRLKQDERKLQIVNNYVISFMDAHGIKTSDLAECPVGISFNDNQLNFKKLDELEKEERDAFFKDAQYSYPEYILKSECWKVAYYDYVQAQYDKVLHEVKMEIHRHFMSDTVPCN